MTDDERREILRALARVEQQLKNLRDDVQIANHASEQRNEITQREIVNLRADLAGVMSTSKENKKKSRSWRDGFWGTGMNSAPSKPS